MFGYVGDAEDWGAYGPLLYCLGFAVENVAGKPVDYFLRGILNGDEDAPSGGDPGWVLYRDRFENGQVVYHAFTNPEMSGLDPSEADYDEVTVKLHVRRTLDNFAKAHPERQAEVREVVTKYRL
jgi:hypothetical protein